MKKKEIPYTYDLLEADIKKLAADFGGLEWGSIGQSRWGKELFYIRLGHGKKKISYNGAHHGMEWITSVLLMKFAGDYLLAEKEKCSLGGFSVEALSEKASLYIIPMVNPDGVELAALGKIPSWVDGEERKFLLNCNGSPDFGRWQANGAGVDLNHNYDAMWERSKALENEYGVYGPGPTRYSGPSPLSEPESSALANFTLEKDFEIAIAFHSQGKVIYQGFCGKEPPVSMKIARAFEKISPYRLEREEGIASVGGYKDWFVDKLGRPGFTVEVGEGRNPLPARDLPAIYKETLPILAGAMTV